MGTASHSRGLELTQSSASQLNGGSRAKEAVIAEGALVLYDFPRQLVLDTINARGVEPATPQLAGSFGRFVLNLRTRSVIGANAEMEILVYSTYRLKADELSADFIKALKMTYQHRQIEIIVQDVQDETEYLMSSPANHEHLSRAIENVNNRTNLVYVNPEDL